MRTERGENRGWLACRHSYFKVVKKGIVEAARQANANPQPARIGFGTGKAYVNTNRDEMIGAGYHMGYEPDGPSDKTVAVILLTKPSGEPIAISQKLLPSRCDGSVGGSPIEKRIAFFYRMRAPRLNKIGGFQNERQIQAMAAQPCADLRYYDLYLCPGAKLA
jgi:hypothetical protein